MRRLATSILAALAATLCPMRAELSGGVVDLAGYTSSADAWATGNSFFAAYDFDDRLSEFRRFRALLQGERRRIASGAIVGSRIQDFVDLCRRHVDKPLAAHMRLVDRDFQGFVRDLIHGKRTPELVGRTRRHLRAVTRRITALRATRVYLTGGINAPVDSLAQFTADFDRALKNKSRIRSLFIGIPTAVAPPPDLQLVPWELGRVGAPITNLNDPAPAGFVITAGSFSFPDAADTASHLPYLRNYEGTYTYTLGKTARFRTPWLSYQDQRMTCSPASDKYRMPLICAYNSRTGNYNVVRVLAPGDTADLAPYFP